MSDNSDDVKIIDLLRSTQKATLTEIEEASFWVKGKIHITASSRILQHRQATQCNQYGIISPENNLYTKDAPPHQICKNCSQSLSVKAYTLLKKTGGVIFNKTARLLQPQDIILRCFSEFMEPLTFINIANLNFTSVDSEDPQSSIIGTARIRLGASRYRNDTKVFTFNIPVYILNKLCWVKGTIDSTINYMAKEMATGIINYFGPLGGTSSWRKETEDGLFK